MLCFTAAEVCKRFYLQESGTIDYPSGNSNYENNEHCVWNVQLPDSDKKIVVNVTEFNVEYQLSCENDYLEVSICTYLPGILIRTVETGTTFLVRVYQKPQETCTYSRHVSSCN